MSVTPSIHCDRTLGRDMRAVGSFGRRIVILVPLLTAFALSSAARAQQPSPAATSRDALTLLEAHCVKCHGGEKTKAGLDLTTREALLRGGESGADVFARTASRNESALPDDRAPGGAGHAAQGGQAAARCDRANRRLAPRLARRIRGP